MKGTGILGIFCAVRDESFKREERHIYERICGYRPFVGRDILGCYGT
jgi:hypothetical protein